jgi:hypothetical protein
LYTFLGKTPVMELYILYININISVATCGYINIKNPIPINLNFVNRDGTIDDIVNDYDYSSLNSTFEIYEEISINGNEYIVMRVD